MSEWIAWIQVAEISLGLNWRHPRVQAWLSQATAVYVARCERAGEMPQPSPPYLSRADLPNVLVVELGKKMRAAMMQSQSG